MCLVVLETGTDNLAEDPLEQESSVLTCCSQLGFLFITIHCKLKHNWNFNSETCLISSHG